MIRTMTQVLCAHASLKLQSSEMVIVLHKTLFCIIVLSLKAFDSRWSGSGQEKKKKGFFGCQRQCEVRSVDPDTKRFKVLDSSPLSSILFTPSPSPATAKAPFTGSFSSPSLLSKHYPTPKMSTTPAFVCQESFRADNTTSCIRFEKVKQCIKNGNENHLNFLCVDHDSIAIGGSGPVPPPADVNMTVFLCSVASCPNEAPEKKKKHGDSNSPSSATKDKALTWSGFMVLALIASQLVFF
ncbi:MAG: hypothetical protein J3Q66DRAFT_330126 [Benniella sp.]|nr:MAG: hypothetical protein J3Q66DRAFT_330126 [Benniella sp.]